MAFQQIEFYISFSSLIFLLSIILISSNFEDVKAYTSVISSNVTNDKDSISILKPSTTEILKKLTSISRRGSGNNNNSSMEVSRFLMNYDVKKRSGGGTLHDFAIAVSPLINAFGNLFAAIRAAVPDVLIGAFIGFVMLNGIAFGVLNMIQTILLPPIFWFVMLLVLVAGGAYYAFEVEDGDLDNDGDLDVPEDPEDLRRKTYAFEQPIYNALDNAASNYDEAPQYVANNNYYYRNTNNHAAGSGKNPGNSDYSYYYEYQPATNYTYSSSWQPKPYKQNYYTRS